MYPTPIGSPLCVFRLAQQSKQNLALAAPIFTAVSIAQRHIAGVAETLEAPEMDPRRSTGRHVLDVMKSCR